MTEENELQDISDKVKFIGLDDWHRRLFQTLSGKHTLVDVEGELHTMTDEGEPLYPMGLATPETPECTRYC